MTCNLICPSYAGIAKGNVMEKWKDAFGLDGLYEVSTLGRIRSKAREVEKYNYLAKKIIRQKYKAKIINGCAGKWGHIKAHLSIRGKKIVVSVHRIVLLTFRGEPLCGQEACHNNGNAKDNRLLNLRWDTHYNNNQDRKKHGRYHGGERHTMSKLTKKQVEKIKLEPKGGVKVAKKYGIGTSQFWRIRKGLSWA